MEEKTAAPTGRVRLFGLADWSEAYRIRDLLTRSVVAFDWIELASDEDCAASSACWSLATSGCRSSNCRMVAGCSRRRCNNWPVSSVRVLTKDIQHVDVACIAAGMIVSHVHPEYRKR